MKNRLLIAGISAIVLLYACRKEFDFSTKEFESIDSQSLDAAKMFHAKGATLNAKTYKALFTKADHAISEVGKKPPTRRAFIKLAPQWKKAYTLKSLRGEDLIVVPTIENKLKGDYIEIKRFFVFRKQGADIKSANIIEILGLNYSLKNKIDEIIAGYKSNKVSDFNGAVLEYDLNYFSRSGIGFTDGKRILGPVRLKSVPIAMKSTKGITTSGSWETDSPDANGCRKLWYCYGTTVGTRCDFSEYLYCNTAPPPPSGSDSGTDTSGQNGGGGEYTGNTPPPAIDIVNHITDPCLNSTVGKALLNDVVFNVEYSVNSIFNTNDDVNLNIYQDYLFEDGNAAVEQYNGPPTAGSGASYVTIGITINTTLNSASAEYVTSTVIHEALHGYFSYRDMLTPNQHQLMADSYIGHFTRTMLEIFPNIDPATNTALAWGGLHETTGWTQKTVEERNAIIATNLAHQSGSVGTGQTCY